MLASQQDLCIPDNCQARCRAHAWAQELSQAGKHGSGKQASKERSRQTSKPERDTRHLPGMMKSPARAQETPHGVLASVCQVL